MKMRFKPRSDDIEVEVNVPTHLQFASFDIAAICMEAINDYEWKRSAAEWRAKEDSRFSRSVKFDF